jgi:hypothetical protein
MKGLDGEELEVVDCIVRGWAPQHIRRLDGALDRLKRRGLISVTKVNCGAEECPGHRWVEMTSTGMLVWHAVRTVR